METACFSAKVGSLSVNFSSLVDFFTLATFLYPLFGKSLLAGDDGEEKVTGFGESSNGKILASDVMLIT